MKTISLILKLNPPDDYVIEREHESLTISFHHNKSHIFIGIWLDPIDDGIHGIFCIFDTNKHMVLNGYGMLCDVIDDVKAFMEASK